MDGVGSGRETTSPCLYTDVLLDIWMWSGSADELSRTDHTSSLLCAPHWAPSCSVSTEWLWGVWSKTITRSRRFPCLQTHLKPFKWEISVKLEKMTQSLETGVKMKTETQHVCCSFVQLKGFIANKCFRNIFSSLKLLTTQTKLYPVPWKKMINFWETTHKTVIILFPHVWLKKCVDNNVITGITRFLMSYFRLKTLQRNIKSHQTQVSLHTPKAASFIRSIHLWVTLLLSYCSVNGNSQFVTVCPMSGYLAKLNMSLNNRLNNKWKWKWNLPSVFDAEFWSLFYTGNASSWFRPNNSYRRAPVSHMSAASYQVKCDIDIFWTTKQQNEIQHSAWLHLLSTFYYLFQLMGLATNYDATCRGDRWLFYSSVYQSWWHVFSN